MAKMNQKLNKINNEQLHTIKIHYYILIRTMQYAVHNINSFSSHKLLLVVLSVVTV